MGIVMFGFVTLIIPLLLTILPAVFLTFARGVRPVYKVFWVSLSLLPIVTDVLLERYRFPKGVFVFSPWALYLLFLWFGRAQVGGRRGWRHYGLALSSVVYVGLMVWFGISVYADYKDAASAHDIYWPMDLAGDTYVTLRLPPHYGAPAVVKPTVGAPDRLEQIDVSLLWPSLETRNYRNDPEFDGLGTKVLKIEVHVLNRVLYEGRHVNNLACAFEFATNEFGKDCFDPQAVPLTGDPTANLTPRYGLSRRGPSPKWMPSLETWFNLTEDGTVSTMVECPREGDGPIYGECKHSFEIPELNATVVTRYNGAYLPQWMEIQRAVTNIFLAMRR